tara:strand:- start:4387 stop:4833 length:447 start_codon:yes stop_codon:yes gene_type:complete
MAHFAKISEENEVLTVLFIEDKYLQDENGVEQESIGQAYLETHNNWPAHLWIQTSYNTGSNQHKNGGTPFRGNYAGVGMKWYPEHGVFMGAKPYALWVYDSSIACWQSPIGNCPELTQEQLDETIANGNPVYRYDWNEPNQTWDLVTL